MTTAARPRARALERVSIALGVILALDVALLFFGGKAPAPAPEGGTRPLRVGLVFDVGGRGDKSFNDAAYVGLVRAVEELGVTPEYIEPAGSEDREAALRIFAARDFDLVMGVGFIFTSDLMTIAREYPDVSFAGVDLAAPAEEVPANLLGLKFREEQASFLVGAAAALLSRSHRVGFIGGMDIPLIHKFEAGYRAGVEAVCPECEVAVAYAGVTPEAFKDPAKGKELALAQIGRGVDVIYHASGSTGLGVFEAARQGQALAIGVDSDQYGDMPGVVVTSMVKRVDVAVYDAILAVRDGQFHGGLMTFGLAEDGVDWVHEGPHARDIPPEVVRRVEELRHRIVRGEIEVPSTREALETWSMP